MCRTVCAALRIAVRMASSTLVWLLPTISLSRYTWSDTAASWARLPGAVVSPPAGRHASGAGPGPATGGRLTDFLPAAGSPLATRPLASEALLLRLLGHSGRTAMTDLHLVV